MSYEEEKDWVGEAKRAPVVHAAEKAKRTAKQLAAAKRNLAKAKKARAEKKKPKRSPAQIAAAKKNLAKAQKAQRAAKRAKEAPKAKKKAARAPARPAIPVRKSYPRWKELQADLTRYEAECFTTTQARRLSGEQRRRHCIAVAWKRARLAGRHPSYFKESPMAGKARRTKAQKEASLRNLRKARSALRAKHGGGGHKKPKKRKSAAREPLGKGGHVKPGYTKVERHPVHAHRKTRGPYQYKQTTKQKAAALRNLKKARAARKSGAKENPTGGVLENKLEVMDIVLVGVLGVVGIVTSSLVDRALATHKVTPQLDAQNQPMKDTNGTPLFTDKPAQGQVYNVIAVDAPMNAARWIVGGLLAVVPLGIAQVVDAPLGRASLQGFGFGCLFRVAGKGANDLLAYVFRKMAFGQQLFAPEINAASYKKQMTAANAAAPAAAPAIPAGVAGFPVKRIGAGCGGGCCEECDAGRPCANGGGTRVEPTRNNAPPPPPPPPPPPTATQNPPPSIQREVTPLTPINRDKGAAGLPSIHRYGSNDTRAA